MVGSFNQTSTKRLELAFALAVALATMLIACRHGFTVTSITELNPCLYFESEVHLAMELEKSWDVKTPSSVGATNHLKNDQKCFNLISGIHFQKQTNSFPRL